MLKVEKVSSQIRAQRWELQKNQFICKKNPNFGVVLGGWETKALCSGVIGLIV